MASLLRFRFALLIAGSLVAGVDGSLRAQTPEEPVIDSGPAAAEAKADNNAAVKVFATLRALEPLKPWTRGSPRDVSGSGVVIEGNRILTNAHVVMYAGQIQVQANDSDAKITAKVEAIAPGIDLAVLKLSDDSLFAAHHPLPRSHVLPQMRDAVTVYGFPTGGTSISISKGIVSRIEYTAYNYPVSGLRIQIDAAINPGNSGGPAMVGDQMIGLAFARVKEAQSIGYIIPCEEIELFLKSVARGAYRGKPALFDAVQPLQNAALRRFLKLDPAVQGVLVHEPNSSDSAYPLKRWDVITQIGGVPIDDEGMVKIGGLRVNYRYVVQSQGKEDSIPLTLLRAGKAMTVTVPLATERPQLIYDLRGAPIPYFIFGPLTFAPATVELMGALLRTPIAANLMSAVGNPLMTRRADRPAFPGEQLVVVSAAPFPSSLMQGYPKPELEVVKSVNGIPIVNLRQLVEVLRDSRDEFIEFEFAGISKPELILPRKEAEDTTNDILSDNGIRAQGSPELMKVWTAQAAK